MQKQWIVFWRGKYDAKWSFDGIYADERLAHLKLEMETIEHPTWDHYILEVEVPAKIEESSIA